MLDEYFDFIKSHRGHRWIHWNMRDINYGFAAIEHRYRVLGGTTETIEEGCKFDMSRMLIDIFTPRYAPHPRFLNLVKLNDISPINMLSGEEEAEAFENQEFVKLHQSTLRKIDILPNIAERVVNRTIKTKTKFWQFYTIKDFGYFLQEHWVASIIMFSLAVAGIIIGMN